jgi:hypothetical protein
MEFIYLSCQFTRDEDEKSLAPERMTCILGIHIG